MACVDKVRGIHLVPEETKDHIYHVLFVDDTDKCTQCEHPENWHEVELQGVLETLVVCDCRRGSKAGRFLKDLSCYNDEMKEVLTNYLRASELGEM